jgi:diguanylate cyclase (GGDEF)-like protein
VIFLGGIYEVMFQQLAYFAVPPINSWFGLIHLESLIYTIASAVFMIMMCKERLEIEYIKAAHLDPLTGVANRTAFFDVAERLLARCRADNQPVSVVVFDLDRFKSINDTYGHAVGDRVLISFVTAAKAVLRPNDFLGRYGGEEFVAVLPGATTEDASVVADRIRNAFGDRCRELDGLQLCATVSAGVAAADASATLSNAVELADRALYRAKNRGRNRIESADDSRPDKRPKLIRVA